MKLCDLMTDQQIGVFALLAICAIAVGFGIDGAKDILQTVAGALAGWLSKSAS